METGVWLVLGIQRLDRTFFFCSCACDGYVNSLYTISIGSITEQGVKPYYLEQCTSTLAVTYSSGDSYLDERSIATTDLRHGCTEAHSGTSASAPMAAGIIALALEANPSLTWRDVMYLIVLTSRYKAIKTDSFFQNRAGFHVSTWYGYGLMDAGRMTELASTWLNVPQMRSCSTQNSPYKT